MRRVGVGCLVQPRLSNAYQKLGLPCKPHSTESEALRLRVVG